MEDHTLKSCENCHALIPKTTIAWSQYRTRRFCSRLCTLTFRYGPVPAIKHCAYCNAPLEHRKRQGAKTYARRAYCSIQCLGAHRHAQLYDDQGNKWCNSCASWKPLDSFSAKAQTAGFCTECNSKKTKAYRARLGKAFYERSRSRLNETRKKLSLLMACAKHRSAKRGIAFNLTIDHLLHLWERQEGKCFYSGLPMTNINKKNKFAAKVTNVSLDRIEPAKGYVIGNVVLCRTVVNVMKFTLSVGDFLEYVERIQANKGNVAERLGMLFL